MAEIEFKPLYSGGSLYLTNHAVPVILDVDGMEGAGDSVPCFFQHDPQQPVGNVQIETEETDGLKSVNAAGEFLTGRNGAWAFEVKRLAAAGWKWEASIRTARPRVSDVENVPAGKAVKVNGRDFTGPCKIFRRWKPVEASFVFYGADPYNVAEVAANGAASHFIIEKEYNMPDEVREYIASLGVDPNEVTPEQATVYERCYKAQQAAVCAEGEAKEEKPAECEGEGKEEEKPAECEGEGEEEEKPAEAEGEEEEKPEIDEKLKAYIESLGKDPAALTPEEIAVFEVCFKAAANEAAASGGFRNRPNPAIHLKKGTTANVQKRPDINKVLALSLAETYLPGVHKSAAVAASGQFSQAVINEALDAKHRGLTLGELMAMAYEQKTNTRIRLRKPAGYARACLDILNGDVRASGAFSTMNPLTILEDAMNVQYLDGFEQFNGVGDRICDVNYNENLQKVDYTYYDVKGPLEIIQEGGEIPSVTLADAKFTTQVYTYAEKLTLTEDMIINDRFDAFMRIPRKMGRVAAAMREAVIFKTLCDNLATLCTAGHGNTMTAALSVAGLDTATQKLGEMETAGTTGAVPMFTYLDGKFLLVPNSLAATARTIYTGSDAGNLIGLQPDKIQTDPYAGRYEPIASPYFGSRGYGSSNGDTHWALLSDPAECAALMLSYMTGEEKPKIEEFPTPPNVLGKTWRCCYRFGVAPGDWRGIVYSTGAGT